jgi:hypothetical protein
VFCSDEYYIRLLSGIFQKSAHFQTATWTYVVVVVFAQYDVQLFQRGLLQCVKKAFKRTSIGILAKETDSKFSSVLDFFPHGATQPIVGVYFTALYRALASSSTRLLDHTQRSATIGRTPLNE